MKVVHEPGKVAGVLFTFGGQDYIVPPLNLEGVELHEKDIERVQNDPNLPLSDKIELISGVVLTACRRNYPEMKSDFLKKWLDLANIREVFSVVMAQSGFSEGEPGE